MNCLLCFFVLFIGSNCILINTDKTYVCTHVNTTFGKDYGNETYTGGLVLAEPLDTCEPIAFNYTNKVVMILQNKANGCHPALQSMYAQQTGAIGVVFVKEYDPWTSFDTIQDSIPTEGNITIPVVGILYEAAAKIEELLEKNSSLTVSICYDGIYEPFSFWDYILMFVVMVAIMWGSWCVLTFFAKAADMFKRYRRKHYVKQIKTTHYHAKHYKDAEEQPVCSICLCELEENDKIKVLRCGHIFHDECIDPWLINEKAICPVCRQGIYQIEDWNLLEENESRDIDIMLARVEARSASTFSNIFICFFCLCFMVFPFIYISLED